MRKILILLVGLILGLQAFAATFTFKFDGKGFISDGADVIDDADKDKILFYSEYVKAQTSYSILVVTLDTLDGVSVNRVAKVISEKGGNSSDTIVLVVAIEEGKIGVEIGENLKSEISYIVLKDIIQNDVTPYFQKGEYSKAITGGVYSISRMIEPSLVFVNPESQAAKAKIEPMSKPLKTHAAFDMKNEYIIGIWLALFAMILLFFRNSSKKVYKPKNVRGGFGNDFEL